ncbi:ATP synthase subunit delta [Arthrobacter sp. Hiyo6]|nr:ATP synthase subunit delta [Arthrobacter sp. Hiyo6]
MAGVSSESLTAALIALEAKLPTASLQLANELFGILGTVDSSAGLRRALTDPSRSGAEKSALVKELFGGKVSPDAVEIASGLASSRWASARDIGDALETLAASVVIAVAENKSAVSASGLTGLEQLENDLFSFNHAVESNHEVQRALSEPQASPAAKIALAGKLVPSASEEAKVLIGQAVSQPRGLKQPSSSAVSPSLQPSASSAGLQRSASPVRCRRHRPAACRQGLTPSMGASLRST